MGFGVAGEKGLGSGDGRDFLQGIRNEGEGIASVGEERYHFVGLDLEVRIGAADASETEELRKGNAGFGGLGMAGSVVEVGMAVCGFVVD